MKDPNKLPYKVTMRTVEKPKSKVIECTEADCTILIKKGKKRCSDCSYKRMVHNQSNRSKK